MGRKRKRSESPSLELPWWYPGREPIQVDTHIGKSYIAELPIELLELIAIDLDLTDVCSIRATCKRLHGALLGPLVRAFFAAYFFRLLDRNAMQLLCNVSQKQDLARHIRSLRLWPDGIDPKTQEIPAEADTWLCATTASVQTHDLSTLDTIDPNESFNE